MSKSLKQMAYDTIEAHQETIADLRTQLAKANERVRELEEDLAVSNGFIAKKMPIVFAISGKNRGAKLVYEEAVKVLNKFAIEQQRKGIEDYKKSDEFCRLLDSHFNSGKTYGHNEYYEQLRKEQE